jgi:hypothetical protein
MAPILGIAALKILQISIAQKFIYLPPIPLLVSDTECDGQTDVPILRICVYIHALVIFVCIFLFCRHEISRSGKASFWFHSLYNCILNISVTFHLFLILLLVLVNF